MRAARHFGSLVGLAGFVALAGLAAAACGTHTTPHVAARADVVRGLGVRAEESAAHAVLPALASEPVELRARGLVARVASRGAAAVSAERDGHVRVHAGALEGADLARVVTEDGFEDLTFFDAAPAREELVWDLDVRGVAGLRRVGGVLELLDREGTPRLHVERPWLVDARGVRRELDLEVRDCAIDEDGAAPWNRAVTPPGRDTCALRVAWAGSGATYPIVVDPVWRLATAMPSPRQDHASLRFPSGAVLAIAGQLSCPGLCGNGATNTGALWDPTRDAWTGLLVAVPRGEPSAALLGSGRALVVCGPSRPDLIASDGRVGRAFGSASFGDGCRAASLPSGRVLVTGGGSAMAMQFDEALDDFVPAGGGAMRAVRSRHTVTPLASGKVLLAGGEGAGGPLSSAEIYDPVTDTFTLVPTPMTAPRASHMATRLGDGTVLLAGGGSPTAEIYDPTTNTFAATGAMTGDRYRAGIVTLASGNALVLGGEPRPPVERSAPTAAVELYDPSARVFRTASPLLEPRTASGAVLLNDAGDVMVTGGRATVGFSVSSVEVWSPGAPGTACLTRDDCRSGACEEGVCCAAPCPGACQTCVAGSGACATVTRKDDPNSCTGATTCDPGGACKKKNGQACGAGSECASAACVDGTCCDRACGGQCEACDVKGFEGTCAPVAGAPRGGRPACEGSGEVCGGACNGLDGTRCVFPSAVKACGSSCAGGELTPRVCDGSGACVAEVRRSCPGNFVCADAVACKFACARDEDCVTGYRCDANRCLPIALCEDRFVTTGEVRIDCSPYTCEQAGTCRTRCASVADCVAGHVCSFEGACILPPAPPEPGCAVAPSRASSGRGLAALAFALGVLLARRRRVA